MSFKEYFSKLAFWGKVKFVTTIIAGIVAVVFATLNWKSQEINLLFVTKKFPLVVMLLFCFLAGCAFGYLLGIRKKDNRKDDDFLE